MKLRITALRRLDSNVEDTYFFLRSSLGVIAVLLPLVLWLGGLQALGIPPQTSISAYYHTEMRDVLVGGLFAVGLTLLIYKGFSFVEDWLLNAAGALIVGVAYFPMNPSTLHKCFPTCQPPCMAYASVLDQTPDALIAIGIHGYCAVAFFIAIGSVCIFCSGRTLPLIENQSIQRAYSFAYRTLGVAMVALPLAAAAVLRFSPTSGSSCTDRTVFWIEASGIWVFATFWLLKTYESHKYGTDRKYPNRRGAPTAAPILGLQAATSNERSAPHDESAA
jgi:hypothetical protein